MNIVDPLTNFSIGLVLTLATALLRVAFIVKSLKNKEY